MKKNQKMKTTHGLQLKIILLVFPVLFIATFPGNGFSQQITAQAICIGGETFVSANYSLDFAIGENDIVVYPNPSANHAYLLCNADTKPLKVEVRDIQGKTILSSNFNTNPMFINLNQLKPGFYTIVILYGNHQTINKKIIKQ